MTLFKVGGKRDETVKLVLLGRHVRVDTYLCHACPGSVSGHLIWLESPAPQEPRARAGKCHVLDPT